MHLEIQFNKNWTVWIMGGWEEIFSNDMLRIPWLTTSLIELDKTEKPHSEGLQHQNCIVGQILKDSNKHWNRKTRWTTQTTMITRIQMLIQDSSHGKVNKKQMNEITGAVKSPTIKPAIHLLRSRELLVTGSGLTMILLVVACYQLIVY